MSRLDGSQIVKLLSQARRHDDGAVSELLQVYQSYVMLLAQLQIDRRLQGKVSASDIAQETLVEAQRCFPQFQGNTERELVVWLRKILASQLTRQIRRYTSERRDVRLERTLDRELDRSSHALQRGIAGRETTPSQQAIRRERDVQLAAALAELPPHYREVIVLRHIEGLSFPEISERMDRSMNSVKNLWTRAVAKLRTSMGDR